MRWPPAIERIREDIATARRRDPAARSTLEILLTYLRETLRILSDVLDIGRKPDLWASEYPPLTAQIARKS